MGQIKKKGDSPLLPLFASLLSSRGWTALDIGVVLYTVLTALLVIFRLDTIPEPFPILGFHGLVLALILLLPPRGAAWEMEPPGTESLWRKTVRKTARFLRYTYPLLLVIFFFEEVEQTVNSIAPQAPYWFEPYLYAADLRLFGKLPSRLLSPSVGLLQDEIMHMFYFSYYFIVLGGVVVAWTGGSKRITSGRCSPGPALATAMTSTVFAFLIAFAWYPWLPARGPWENPDLMEGLTPFRGFVFTPIIEWIIERGAVSGGCFPSSHVGGSWGMVLGLVGHHRRAAFMLGLFAVGMSFSCVYTRYHHAVDVPAGLLVGVLGAYLAHRFTAR